jgi:hypothetical protein
MSKAALLDSISPGYKRLAAALESAGFDPAAVIAAPESVKAHIDSAAAAAKSAPEITAAIEAATAELTCQLNDAKAQIAALRDAALAASEATALRDAALADLGIKPKPSAEGAALTQADIVQAVRERASVLAAEKLAKHHLDAPLPVAPSADSAKSNANLLTRAEFSALNPRRQMDFIRGGGRLTD